MCTYADLLSVACCMDFVCSSLQYVVTTLATTAPSVQTRTSSSSSFAADSGSSLEFLGPEMANLQQLLATMTTGETQDWEVFTFSSLPHKPNILCMHSHRVAMLNLFLLLLFTSAKNNLFYLSTCCTSVFMLIHVLYTDCSHS